MLELYQSGAPAPEIAEKYNVSLRSVKRLLQAHGVRRSPVSCADRTGSGRACPFADPPSRRVTSCESISGYLLTGG